MRRARSVVLFGIIAISAMLAGVQSCAVDSFLTCGDACDDGGFDATADASTADASTDGGSTACDPKSCDSYPGDCHASLDDGCGDTINCSAACPAGQVCVVSVDAGSARFFCNGPPACLDAGAPGGNCGTLTNPANGLTTSCGTCTATGFTCASNTCGCGANLCTGGKACCSGATPDCTANDETCCKKKTCANNYVGKCSSAADDGCGATIDCSNNCNVGMVCDVDGSVCCAPQSTGEACTGKCGTVIDNCALSVSCGNCGNDDVCYGSSSCVCGIATCLPGQTCIKGPDHCT